MLGPDLEPVDLTPEQVDYYRGMLNAHADDASAGACLIHDTHRCPDWVNAFARLTAAGMLHE